MIKKSFCWHLCLLFLLKGIDGFGQPELVGKETHDITSSYSFDPGERIYVHTDKNFYLAGEIVWFKAYCIDNNRASGFSKIAYVEIMDRGNKPVLQAKIALDSNGGNGSFYLPLTLSSDHYTLRAYTNWMKNAGSASFFEKPISIVNTTRAPQVKSSQAAPGPYVDFFPEGGQLVEGIEGRVAFRIAGNNGIGLDAKGILVDNIGDTILQFAPYRFGIGQFTFTPAIGKNYKAIILLPGGKLFEQPLPVAEKNGYVMNVISEEGGRLKIKINARIQAAQNGETLLLLVHSRNGVRISREHNITYGSESVIYTDRSQLTPGINYITVFNKDKQPVCERLVFVRPTHSITAELNSDKTAYKTREAVGLVVSLPQTPVDIVNCSISVFQVDSLQDVNGMNMPAYLSLFSELRGTVESPAYYFSNEPGVEQATDNLLLTYGWRRFRGAVESGNAKTSIRFMPEYNGHIISGRVVNITTGKAVAEADCSLTVPSSPFGFYVSRSDSTGVVKFEVKNYYGPGDIIAQVDAPNKNNYRVDFYSPFADEPSSFILPAFSLPASYEDILLQKSIAMQAQNIYKGDSIRRFSLPQLHNNYPFYGRPEISYQLDDYKRFTTMEEVLREYVTPVNVTLRDAKLHLSIFDEFTREVYHDNILVLLDGVPLADYNKIFSYDPLKVKKLDVIPRRYIYESRYFSGIASFETYDGKFDGFHLDSALVAVDYEGLQLQREFYSPRYDINSTQTRIPDLRTTLFWQPQLVAETSKKTMSRFYTSDQKGKFIVVLEGISKKGEPVFATSSFQVE
jgi:hypothetical protein